MKFEEMKTFDRENHSVVFDNLIKFAVAPRPICLASTVDREGHPNLSPFSYFNYVSTVPPICVFSPLTKMRDGSDKHTLNNIKEVPEVVINIVNYAMVQQQSLASTEYGKEINEFEKSGFHPLASQHIRPARVAESPVQLECKVRDIFQLGTGGGAGNLVIAEIVCMHVQENLLDKNDSMNQAALDLVARLGENWYCRVTADNLFEVPKPLRKLGIGVDQLPEQIRLSKTLTGNHLALLANVEKIPKTDPELMKHPKIVARSTGRFAHSVPLTEVIHKQAAALLDEGETDLAWQILLGS